MFIEDILHTLVDTLEVNPRDVPILTSIARQVKKGNAFTDRQYALVKTKLLDHRDKFEFDIEPFLETTRLPLREVDRSQYVSVVSMLNIDTDTALQKKWTWIKIRFPFAKKTIHAVEKLSTAHRKFYFHERGTHDHYFRLTELTVKDVVAAFINKQFDIDPVLVEYYNEIKEIETSASTYLATASVESLTNMHNGAIELISKEIGKIDNDNLIKLVDRCRRYGIDKVEAHPLNNTLTEDIAFRNEIKVNVDPDLHDINAVVNSLIDLDRFPLLVAIDDDNALGQLSSVYNAFSNVVSAEYQSVLFRGGPDVNKYTVNNFIHDTKFNNWVDNSTKIVYINKSKLPKLLLTGEWRPTATLMLTSTRCHTHVNYYIDDSCDLILYHDKEPSLFNLKRSYGQL